MKKRFNSILNDIKKNFAALLERGRKFSEERANDTNRSEENRASRHAAVIQDNNSLVSERILVAELLAAKAFKIGATIVQRSQGPQLLPLLEAKIAEYGKNRDYETASIACFCHLVLAEVFRNSSADIVAAKHRTAAEAITVEPSPFAYFKIVLSQFVESPPKQGADLAIQACEILKVGGLPDRPAVQEILNRTLLDLIDNGVKIRLPNPDIATPFDNIAGPEERDLAVQATRRAQQHFAAGQDAKKSEQKIRAIKDAPAQAEDNCAEALNASRKFDLLLFDLDDTLLNSGNLEEFRGAKNLNNSNPLYLRALKEAAAGLSPLVPENLLLQLKTSFPKLRLGIFTRSPRQYAQTLLNLFFPEVTWDCIVAFEDVSGRTKPAPEGVFYAAKKLGIRDLSRVAVIGDQAADVISAYQAGASAVLFTMAWGSDWQRLAEPKLKRDHYDSIGFIPDAIIESADRLETFVTDPQRFIPALEAADATDGTLTIPNPVRVDIRKHFNNLEGNPRAPLWITVSILGRYFSENASGSRFDFSRRKRSHRVSERLLLAKDGVPYPGSWASCTATYLQSMRKRHLSNRNPFIVCSIPSGGTSGIGGDRLKEFLNRLSSLIGNDGVIIDNNLLSFRDGVRSNKTLNQLERFENVRDHLMVTKPDTVAGAYVVVLDDIVTSGATFFYADRFLKEAGAAHIHCVALAQSIS